MYAAAFIGDKIIDLAGWDQGPGAETSNLSISYNNQFQSISYVGGTWGRQFWRPGTMATVSFDSRFVFDNDTDISLSNVNYYLLTLQNRFANQQGMTFRLSGVDYLAFGNRQVETATGVGTTTSSGLVEFTISGKLVDNSPVSVLIDVAQGTSPQDWIDLAVDAIKNIPQVATFYDVYSLSGARLRLRVKSPYATNDSTLNIAISTPAPIGITNDPTSSTTTSGVPLSPSSEITFYDANVSVAATQVGTSVLLNTSVTGRLTAP